VVVELEDGQVNGGAVRLEWSARCEEAEGREAREDGTRRPAPAGALTRPDAHWKPNTLSPPRMYTKLTLMGMASSAMFPGMGGNGDAKRIAFST